MLPSLRHPQHTVPLVAGGVLSKGGLRHLPSPLLRLLHTTVPSSAASLPTDGRKQLKGKESYSFGELGGCKVRGGSEAGRKSVQDVHETLLKMGSLLKGCA